MIVVIGTALVRAAATDAAREAMKVMMRETLLEDGCISYSLSEDLNEAGRIRISEEWTTMAALEAHFEAPHMTAWRAALEDAGVLERDVKVYDGALVKSL